MGSGAPGEQEARTKRQSSLAAWCTSRADSTTSSTGRTERRARAGSSTLCSMQRTGGVARPSRPSSVSRIRMYPRSQHPMARSFCSKHWRSPSRCSRPRPTRRWTSRSAISSSLAQTAAAPPQASACTRRSSTTVSEASPQARPPSATKSSGEPSVLRGLSTEADHEDLVRRAEEGKQVPARRATLSSTRLLPEPAAAPSPAAAACGIRGPGAVAAALLGWPGRPASEEPEGGSAMAPWMATSSAPFLTGMAVIRP
mmetsp:Transcript_103474/g.288100  ORF Transcript_103474/g.288100 Transcript_103474/m.288100 type:complete len:256 (-) Transcript_103474:262-1029(-)